MKLLHQDNTNIQFNDRDTLDFPRHIHDVLEIVFLRSGSATALCGSSSYQLKGGDVFVSFPNQTHGYGESRDVFCDVVIIPTVCLSHWRNQLSLKLPETPVLTCGSWEHTGIPEILDLIRPERKQLPEPVKQGYAMVIAGKLLPLLRLQDRQTAEGDALRQLLEYLGEHYREPLSRREISAAVGYNESYVSHVFTGQLGTTLKNYITSLRLRDARELLTETDLTVSQISLLLGFGSIRSFNRAFAQEVGCSPSVYRIDNGEKTM